ncbi:MAG TPA: maleylpyruvate isomerase family mycothiol-dependent enzyme [Pseudonocardia sp.]|nr:maleylpyruvate isomerase family mycothiol-dependent enzyme [Pseudonocardia sp.]
MDYAAALIEQNQRFGDLTRAADPQTPVPSCPDWVLRQLVAHVGRGHRWSATIVRERSDSAVDPRTVADGKPPADPEAAVDWLRDSAGTVLDAVERVGADVPVWTFLGPRPAAWWIRRRLHEETVHRADAALALGVPYELAPELAADGVSEWLDIVAARAVPGPESPLDAGRTLHLHAHDDDGLGAAGEWLIRSGPDGLSWEHGHGKGDAAVRGSAVDLLLGILRRDLTKGGELEVLGDGTVWTGWLARTPF